MDILLKIIYFKPIKPSVACRTALFKAAIDFEPEFPPIVDAC